jgi:hypothetical protein
VQDILSLCLMYSSNASRWQHQHQSLTYTDVMNADKCKGGFGRKLTMNTWIDRAMHCFRHLIIELLAWGIDIDMG